MVDLEQNVITLQVSPGTSLEEVKNDSGVREKYAIKSSARSTRKLAPLMVITVIKFKLGGWHLL